MINHDKLLFCEVKSIMVDDNITNKQIHITIDESYFDDVDYNGVAYSDTDTIILKESDDELLLHELIHLLDFDNRTHYFIVELFESLRGESLNESLNNDMDFKVLCDEVTEGYSENDYKHEIYAYFLARWLMDMFEEDGLKALDWIIDIVFDVCDVVLDIKMEVNGEEIY